MLFFIAEQSVQFSISSVLVGCVLLSWSMLLHQWAQALVSVYNFVIQRKAVFTVP